MTVMAALIFPLALTCLGAADEKKADTSGDQLFEKCVKLLKFGEVQVYYVPDKVAAVQALGLLGEERAIPVLVEHLEGEKNDHLRFQIVRALGWIKSPKAIPALEKALKDDYMHTRKGAAMALKEITGKDYKWDKDAAPGHETEGDFKAKRTSN